MKTWRAAIVGLCRWNLLLIHASTSHFTAVYADLFEQLEIICCTSDAQPISMAGGAPRTAAPALLTFHETQRPLAPAMLQCVANGCAGQGGGGTMKPSSLRFT
ncbi:hypothetical protein [Delftia acidovorans]|uniref:hypothetical protein n=1 Tax=Delftia acidovorans TaxID=80866 RepID=UPI001C0C5B31|nr:hypothetical protein [Delftia acidovorans]